MQIAAADKSLGTGPDSAEHWPVPRRQAWFAFVMAFLLMVFDYMDRQVVVAMFPALKAEWGLSDPELRDLVNAGALDLIADTVAAGAPPAEARSWWVSYLAQQANLRGVELVGLPITPAQVARVIELVSSGELTNKLARQVVDGVLAGEGEPDEVVERRGLKVVSDEGALVAAVDEALAAQPDIAEKIRGGKVAAAGAIVGAVMKATRGQADAKRVRELVIERVGA